MKLRFTVEFEVENDWDDTKFYSGFAEGRKKVVEDSLRRDTMQAVLSVIPRRLNENGMTIFGVTISEPQWDGWDNARIEREIEQS